VLRVFLRHYSLRTARSRKIAPVNEVEICQFKAAISTTVQDQDDPVLWYHGLGILEVCDRSEAPSRSSYQQLC
jgi:hypothetical protein